MLIYNFIPNPKVRYSLLIFKTFFFKTFFAFALILLYPINSYPNKTLHSTNNKKQSNSYSKINTSSTFKNKSFKNKTYKNKQFKQIKQKLTFYKTNLIFPIPNKKKIYSPISIKNYLNIDYGKNFKSSLNTNNLFYNKIKDKLFDQSIIFNAVYDDIKKDNMSYYYFRPYNLIEPFMGINSWRLKTDNITIYFDYSNKDFSLYALPTTGIKYQFANGIKLYYFMQPKIIYDPLQSLSYNLGLSFTSSLFQ